VLSLRADYSPSITAGGVYLQVAAWHIATTNSLEILSLVDGLSQLHMPSWVPDWTRKSQAHLPAQPSMLMDATIPRIRSSLEYPRDCILQVSGKRCGTVWTDTRVFSNTPTTNDPQRHRSNYIGHWLHAPSPDSRECQCTERLGFWDQILSAYRAVYPQAGFEYNLDSFQTDIPPSFGGPCKLCLKFCAGYNSNVRHSVSLRRKAGCYCKSLDNSVGHYRKSELEDFLGNINRYGVSRRIFGTDHSLGLGPLELQDWDEVWMLEGSRVPLILRKVDDHYRLVGACYVHAFDRKIHRCSACSGETIQQDITSRPMRDPAVQANTTNITHDAMKSSQLYIVSILRDISQTTFFTQYPVSYQASYLPWKVEVWMKLSPWVGWTQYIFPNEDTWFYWEVATTLTHLHPPTDSPLRGERQEITIR
jgi:hypothetical protein